MLPFKKFMVLLLGKYSELPQETQRNIDDCKHSLVFQWGKKEETLMKLWKLEEVQLA